jgi:hypothetical protein
MRKVFYPYTEWEEWKAGMYELDVQPALIKAAADLLASSKLEEAMYEVTKEFPRSTAHHLTATNENRKAWLGQAACFLKVGAPDDATKSAWWTLTDTERNEANACAERIIKNWEGNYGYAETLF